MISYICRSLISKKIIRSNAILQVRQGHGQWAYRVPPPPAEKKFEIIADVIGGFAWWWILWHFWHDYGHIIGEFPYPDPSKWTDEELGIPPDEDV